MEDFIILQILLSVKMFVKGHDYPCQKRAGLPGCNPQIFLNGMFLLIFSGLQFKKDSIEYRTERYKGGILQHETDRMPVSRHRIHV